VLSPRLVGAVFDTIAQQAATRITHESGLGGEDQQILAAIAEGATSAEIGARLHVSEVTTPYVDPDVIIPYYKGSAAGLRKLGRLADLDAKLTYKPFNFETVA